MGELHITLETVALIVTVITIIAPLFYVAGRFNQRLTTVERQIEALLREALNLGVRIATSLEQLVVTVKESERYNQDRRD